MKKQYTKKQITEAIAYWENQLKSMNESAEKHKFLSKFELLQEYDIEIKRFHDGYVTSVIVGIDPEQNFTPSLPWTLAVTKYIVDCCINFTSKNKQQISIHSIEYGKNPGANVSFEAHDEETLVKFLNDWFLMRDEDVCAG